MHDVAEPHIQRRIGVESKRGPRSTQAHPRLDHIRRNGRVDPGLALYAIARGCDKIAPDMDNGITIRAATVDDVDDIVRLRCLMFESMGYDDPTKLTELATACRPYFDRAVPSGRYIGWLACTAGAAVASIGVVVDEHPPGPGNEGGRVGYIMNLCTDPAYRRQGLARQLLTQALDWIRAQGIATAALHASDMGRSLYTEFGFMDSNEVRAGI